MARANIMMWLASTGNVILAKGFLRYLWRTQPGTPGEKRNRPIGSALGRRWGWEGRGASPLNPTKGRCPLDPHQGRWPLEPFILAVERERANTDLETPGSALSHSTANGQIPKGLALWW